MKHKIRTKEELRQNIGSAISVDEQWGLSIEESYMLIEFPENPHLIYALEFKGSDLWYKVMELGINKVVYDKEEHEADRFSITLDFEEVCACIKDGLEFQVVETESMKFARYENLIIDLRERIAGNNRVMKSIYDDTRTIGSHAELLFSAISTNNTMIELTNNIEDMIGEGDVS